MSRRGSNRSRWFLTLLIFVSHEISKQKRSHSVFFLFFVHLYEDHWTGKLGELPLRINQNPRVFPPPVGVTIPCSIYLATTKKLQFNLPTWQDRTICSRVNEKKKEELWYIHPFWQETAVVFFTQSVLIHKYEARDDQSPYDTLSLHFAGYLLNTTRAWILLRT